MFPYMIVNHSFAFVLTDTVMGIAVTFNELKARFFLKKKTKKKSKEKKRKGGEWPSVQEQEEPEEEISGTPASWVVQS